ncbi:hypothetical protein K0U27_05055 [archaeon]|nr:hypothetical protein [archaeon]
MSQPQQQPTPEQIYQKLNKSKMDAKLLFELVYNEFLKCSQDLESERIKNAQLIAPEEEKTAISQ